MSNHPHVARSQAELAELFAQGLTSGVGRSIKHDSADKHVSGEAVYIDDRLEFPTSCMCTLACRTALMHGC